ncbi:MAG: glycine--tRNA ligase subunit beta [Chloroflexota bacterium]|nr:MAG: glycine--tRNA ligase subunit beta [Chloroflexota bacterium]
MTNALDFQSIIITLQNYWADLGCLIWQPYYAQVGAGTMNPATFLRVLGPEPWNVGYVEPSIRPDDGRYGENPNRMQQHYQFQVILKPDPGNPQEIYLDSLKALGIDPLDHDIRFVEDNWEQPAIGAWGLGWEVWLDGQEITQFTYFQQAGGINIDPVAVELTYGLDRIAIALQRVGGFQDIQWNTVPEAAILPQKNLTAGDVNIQAEQEHSRYYFEVADIGRLRQMYELFEAEADLALERGLVLPAYDYLLKCSHTFNVLDTRGAIGVTERQKFFGRMRGVARKVSEAYLEERQRLEFPWLGEEAQSSASQENISDSPAASRKVVVESQPGSFVFEIGTEELPSADLKRALEQLERGFQTLLVESRLEHGGVHVLGTPRRLVVRVDNLAPNQPDEEKIVKGPPADRAFDPNGQPTPAAQGFARSKGIHVSDLQVHQIDGGEYAAAVVRSEGRQAAEVLAENLPDLIASLRFGKSMRWNSSNVAFSRPIRWLLAFFNRQPLNFTYAGISSGITTRGLRFLTPEKIEIKSADDLLNTLAEQGIILDQDQRAHQISEQVRALAAEVEGKAVQEEDLLEEVTNLVEAPFAVRGSFAEAHLELPKEVLISVMKKHQRYFPVEKNGQLLPYFIAITNRGEKRDDPDLDLVVEGNEHVIRARFEDAAFFITEDVKRPLEDYLPQLDTLTFQADLGSMLAKTERVRELVVDLAPQIGLKPEQVEIARRAAQLCKADLVTHMVVEMTSLQGIMGRYYALESGEPEPVAASIFEHYLPRSAGDAFPVSLPGMAVGLADRLDTLAGLFAIGLTPTGTKDPFGLRRAALGVVGNLTEWDLDFDLRSALQAAGTRLPKDFSQESQEDCLKFIIERQRNLLLEGGGAYDVVDAILAAQGHNPSRAVHAVKALGSWVARADWNEILPAYARCVRITRDLGDVFPVDEGQFEEPAETKLYEALTLAEGKPRSPGSVDDFLNAFIPLIPDINEFFDRVLVMVDDEKIRQNRLGILQRIAALAHGVVDMSRLEGF